MLRLLAALLLLCPTPALAQNSSAPQTAPATSANALAAREQAVAAQTADVAKREADLALRKEIIETRAALDDAGHARLQVIGIWLSALIGLFGIAITIAVLVLTFRAERWAIAAAIQAARDGVEKERQSISNIVASAQIAAEAAATTQTQMISEATREFARLQAEAERSAQEIAHNRDQVIQEVELIAFISTTSIPVTNHDKNKLKLLIEETKDLDEKSLSVDQISAKIGDAAQRKDWWQMRLFAILMGNKFGTTNKYRCLSFYFQAVALSRQRFYDEANSIYDSIVNKYSHIPELSGQVAQSMFNKARIAHLRELYDKAIDGYNEVINEYGISQSEDVINAVSSSYINRGICRSHIGDHLGARSDYQKVVEMFDKLTGDYANFNLNGALFNIACSFAREEDVNNVIWSLEDWFRRVGEKNIDLVDKDEAFDLVRNDRRFSNWLSGQREQA